MTDDPIPNGQADAFTMPLDEFCADISRTDKRVELIAVFRHRELMANRHHDTPAAYADRYAATHDSPTAGNTRPVSV
jgi:hypothetical protein